MNNDQRSHRKPATGLRADCSRGARLVSRYLRPLLLAMATLASANAFAIDWSALDEHEISLFHPGQSSWEWALSAKEHAGAAPFRGGKSCADCHNFEQQDIGEAISAGGHKLEPSPPAGRSGSTTIYLKTAHDAERIYFQLRWTPAAKGAERMSDTAARISLMLADQANSDFARGGCWAACHDDQSGMPSAPDGAAPGKYLGASRASLSRQGGAGLKSAAELQALVDKGTYLEFWEVALNPSQPAAATSGYILEQRHRHEPVAVTADAKFANDQWLVTLSRPLAAAASTHKALLSGKSYTVGLALHDDYAGGRFHLVSLEYRVRLDAGEADILVEAAK